MESAIDMHVAKIEWTGGAGEGRQGRAKVGGLLAQAARAGYKGDGSSAV